MAKKKKQIHIKKAPSFKCRLCGEMIKVTVWRKHLAYFHNLGELPKFQDYIDEDSKGRCKCRICSTIVDSLSWRGHLAKRHNIGENWKFSDFYISANTSTESANRQWYNPQKKIPLIESDWKCGEVVNGPPKVKIIYNALCTNRNKH